jgi:hypothetical protein
MMRQFILLGNESELVKVALDRLMCLPIGERIHRYNLVDEKHGKPKTVLDGNILTVENEPFVHHLVNELKAMEAWEASAIADAILGWSMVSLSPNRQGIGVATLLAGSSPARDIDRPVLVKGVFCWYRRGYLNKEMPKWR